MPVTTKELRRKKRLQQFRYGKLFLEKAGKGLNQKRKAKAGATEHKPQSGPIVLSEFDCDYQERYAHHH